MRQWDALYSFLDAGEAQRAAAFRQDVDRRLFVAAHGGLRLLAGEAMGRAPQALTFSIGPKGKPFCGGSGLEFNLSHSGGVVLIALSRDVPMGIDVERARSAPDHLQIARRYFHANEAAELVSLDEPEAEAAFFRCWTRKEAFIKALGDGLSMPLDSFRVSCLPGSPAMVLSLPASCVPAPWTLLDLSPAEGHFGALAMARQGAAVSLRSLAF
ncbi:MAG: 4'-phosphopantetheinyl transferase superfamily protein [Rhodospirillaceae bacterium]|nr:4'-phosphopantetheinyl transferase superfamily protein [Rhodospirillales bacterium]